MHFLPVLAGFAAAVIVSGSVTTDSIQASTIPQRAVSVYIVQIKKERVLDVPVHEKRFSSHEMFHRSAVDLNYTVRHQYTNAGIFYGLSVKLNGNLTEREALSTLAAIPGVLNAWPVNMIDRPGPIESPLANFTRVKNAKAAKPQSSTTVTPIDNSPTLPKINGSMDVFATHKMADVDKLHALNIKGKGIKIGIIDTGIDYTHPSLGSGFGPGKKVAGGYSFVQDGWDGWR